MPAVITGLNPDTAAVNSDDFTLQVAGTGFTPDAVVIFTGMLPTTFVSDTELTVPVKPSEVSAGTYGVRVQQADGTSNQVPFVFTPDVSALDRYMGLHCISLCNVAPDCVLPTPWSREPQAAPPQQQQRK